MKILVLILLFGLVFVSPAYTQEGYDDESGSYVHPISEKGDTMEFYDDKTGETHTGEVMEKGEGTTEIYDYSTNKYRYLDTTD